MKCLLVFICAVLVVGINAWTFKALLYSDYIDCDHTKNLDIDVSQVQVFFYDFHNNFNMTDRIDTAADTIMANYNLDVTKKLIFFVPGYKGHISKNTEESVRQTFSQVPNTYLIIIDHSPYTSDKDGRRKGYENAVFNTYYLGQALGKLLAKIRAKGFPSKNIHCIGHSLGSQMLGVAGEVYTNEVKEKLWRITGIDPAGPCFSNSFIEDQIRSGVAEYVEVYHCNAGGLGTTSVLADTDFFLNKGTSEPECHGSIIPGKRESDKAKCSHKKCVLYYLKTVPQKDWYLAWKCDKYDDFLKGRCAGNEITIAGYSNPGNATGKFYASTETYGVF